MVDQLIISLKSNLCQKQLLKMKTHVKSVFPTMDLLKRSMDPMDQVDWKYRFNKSAIFKSKFSREDLGFTKVFLVNSYFIHRKLA